MKALPGQILIFWDFVQQCFEFQSQEMKQIELFPEEPTYTTLKICEILLLPLIISMWKF